MKAPTPKKLTHTMEGEEATHPQQLKPHQLQVPSPHLYPPSHRRGGRGYATRFPEGAFVEIRTNEEDYKGVYFAATVVASEITPKRGSRQKQKKQLLVEYHNLLASEEGSKRLRESVDVSFVRPAPHFYELVEGFEPNDAVDAFYKDGWWIGVVTRVVDGGESFIVTFRDPPDELEFRLDQLRVHWDWVDGSWVRPEKQSITGNMFDVGRKVEVSSDREDCQGAWFPAILRKVLKNGFYSVECMNVGTSDKNRPRKVTINYIRPRPPLLREKNFNLLEKVDAFFDNGWWNGVITKELENRKYVVYFKQMKREKEFKFWELRPHMEWKDGKWYTSSQLSQDVPIPSSDEGMHEHHTPENPSPSAPAFPVNNSGGTKNICDVKSPLISNNQKPAHGTSSLTKRNQHLSNSQNALSRSPEQVKDGDGLATSQQDRLDSSSKDMLFGSVSPNSVSKLETSATLTATEDQPSDNLSWGTRIRRKQRTVDATLSVSQPINSASSDIKKNSIQMLQPDVGGKVRSSIGNTAEDVQTVIKEVTELPIIIGLPCPEIGSSEYGKSRIKRSCCLNSKDNVNIVSDKKQKLNDLTKDSKYLGIGESSEKRKRGRPRKILITSIRSPVTDDFNKEDEDPHKVPEVDVMGMDVLSPNQEMLELDEDRLSNYRSHPKNIKGTTMSPPLKRGRRPITSIPTPQTGNAQNVVGSDDLNEKDGDPRKTPEVDVIRMDVSSPNQENMKLDKDILTNDRSHPKNRKGSMTKLPMKRGRRTTGEKTALPTQDSLNVSGGKVTEVNQDMEVEKFVCEAFNNGFEDEPLSKWIEGMNSQSPIDGSKRIPVSIVEQHMENGDNQRDGIGLEVNIGLVVDSETQPEGGSQAFKKRQESETQSYALVVRDPVVPSEPQSLPFLKNTILWKTIESMDVFQKIPQRPHFKPLEQFKESSREGLAIGYMVTFSGVVEKVSTLKFDDPKSITDDILETLEDLEKQGFDVRVVQDRVTVLLSVKDKEEKLGVELNEVNNQISGGTLEKNKIDEEINEINEQIRNLQEKLSLAQSAKENKDGMIASLQVKLKATKESIKNVRHDFEDIASSTF